MTTAATRQQQQHDPGTPGPAALASGSGVARLTLGRMQVIHIGTGEHNDQDL
jgi:hypothetical protein